MSTPTHRPGCSEQRNTKCLCEYLSQWDSKPALPQEIHNTDNPGLASGLTARYENSKQKLLNEFDLDEPQDWADAPINKLSLPVVITSGHADPAEVAEKIVRDNPQWFGELPPETYIKREPGRTPGDEAAFDMWKNRALNAERHRFHLTAGGTALLALLGVVAWAAAAGVI